MRDGQNIPTLSCGSVQSGEEVSRRLARSKAVCTVFIHYEVTGLRKFGGRISTRRKESSAGKCILLATMS